MRYIYYTIWLIFPKLRYGIDLDSFNPFTGFGLLDSFVEHSSAKDIQHRGHDFDREMWEKQSAFAVEQFGRESDFTKEMMDKQYRLNLDAVQETPARLMKGLKSAGLNPILAATGGFRANAPGVSGGSAKATAGSPSRGGSTAGARANTAAATLMKDQSQLLKQQKQTTAQQGWYYGAQAQKAISEAKKADQETIREQYRNVKEGNIADVHTSSFGKFMAWAEVAGLDKVGAGAAIALGGAAIAKLLGKLLIKAPNPFIKGTKQYRIFEQARKREDKL
jgi:hypothetical protein